MPSIPHDIVHEHVAATPVAQHADSSAQPALHPRQAKGHKKAKLKTRRAPGASAVARRPKGPNCKRCNLRTRKATSQVHPGPRHWAHHPVSAANDFFIGEASGPGEQLAQNQENELHRQSQARHMFGTTGYESPYAIGDSQPNQGIGWNLAITGVQKTSCVLMPLARRLESHPQVRALSHTGQQRALKQLMVLRVSHRTDKPEPAKVMVLGGFAALLDMQSATTWVTNTLVSMQRPSIISTYIKSEKFQGLLFVNFASGVNLQQGRIRCCHVHVTVRSLFPEIAMLDPTPNWIQTPIS